MRKVGLLSDLHFDDKPRNEHRFDLFRQVSDAISKYRLDAIFVLGDILDQKDKHPGKLLNRVVDGLVEWSDKVEKIIVLHGNHDSLDASSPYLYFLRHIPKLEYINTPHWDMIPEDLDTGRDVYFLPHTRHPLEDWKDCDLTGRIVFTHATVRDSITENGFKLSEAELEASFFDGSLKTFGGDIHKAQTLGKLEYVGSPYDTRFNRNSYPGRMIVFDFGTLEQEDVMLDFPRRLVFDVQNWEEFEYQLEEQFKGHRIRKAQVKIRLHLTKETMGSWREEKQKILRQFINYPDYEFVTFEMVNDFKTVAPSVTPNERKFTDYESFCKKHQILDDLKAVGKSLIEATR